MRGNPTKEELRIVSDSMFAAAKHLADWEIAHLKLEVILIAEPWLDFDGKIREAVDEMAKAARQIGLATKSLGLLCEHFDLAFPDPTIGEPDNPEKVMKYAMKIYEKAEDMIARSE